MGNFKANSKKAPAKPAADKPTKKSFPPFKGMKKTDVKIEKIIKKKEESSSDDEEENSVMDVSTNQHLDSSSSSPEESEKIVVKQKNSIVKKEDDVNSSSSDDDDNKDGANSKNHANYSLMLSNLDSGANAEELRQFLINKGIPVEGFHFIKTPIAILQMSTNNDLKRLRGKMQGMKFKTNELCCVKVSGNLSRMLVNKKVLPGTIRSKNILFVSRIPADCSKADLKNFLKDFDDSTYTILIAYHKVKKNIAISAQITFEDETAAKSALTLLQGKVIRGLKMSATYAVDKSNQVEKTVKDLPTNEDLRGKTATFLVRNLPNTSDYAKLKSLFPSAIRYEIIKRNNQSNNCFVQFADAENCSQNFDEYQDKEIDGQQIRIAFVPTRAEKKKVAVTEGELGTQLKISNLPFSKTQPDLVKEFPTAASVFLKTNNMKKSVGSCFLTFNSKEDCVAVFNACKKKSIDGRPLRCEPWSETIEKDQDDTVKNNAANYQFAMRLFNLPYEADFKAIKKCFPNAVRVTVLKDGTTGKPRGMAVVNFNSDAECEEALKKCPTSMIGGRKIRGERQVDVKAGEKLTLVAENKSKETSKVVVSPTKKVKNEPEDEEADDDEESGDEEEESSDEEVVNVKPGLKRSFKEIANSKVAESKKAKITAKPTESSDEESDEEDDEEEDDDSDD